MKSTKTEDEYIWVQELQQRMGKLAKEQQAQSEAEKQRLKEAHWMHCPKCGQKLATETCGAVEIDVCPSCKGVWLDMGELGTIVESASQNNFFNKCLRIIRKDNPASPHHSPHLTAKSGTHHHPG
jgi:Zn-finger nucleic acid-binding protein